MDAEVMISTEDHFVRNLVSLSTFADGSTFSDGSHYATQMPSKKDKGK
jgi:hypothetical protein